MSNAASKKRRRLACGLGVFVFLSSGLFNSQAQVSFEGSGRLIFTIVQEDGRITQSNVVDFKIVVQDCNWKIREIRLGDTNFDYFEASYDGTNLYKISNYQSAAERFQGGVQAAGGIIASATLDNSCVPHFIDIDELPVIWFAYASSCCLKQRTTVDSFEPISLFGNQVAAFPFLLTGRFQLPFHQVRSSNSVAPDRAVWLDDGLVYSEEGPVRKMSPPFDKGFTNSVFQTLERTSVNGVEIPSHFTLVTYRPKIGAKTLNDLLASYLYEGWLSNSAAAKMSAVDFVLPLPGGTHVVDQRFIRDKPPIERVSYEVKTNWPALAEVKRMPEYRAELQMAQRVQMLDATANANPRTRVYVLIGMTTLGVGLLIFLIKTYRRGQIR